MKVNPLLKNSARIILSLLALVQAWSSRHEISSLDGISYLELGRAYMRGDWEHAISAYWSPLYSWILGPVFSILNPSPDQEFFCAKVVNFVIFLPALFSFEWFFKQAFLNSKKRQDEPALNDNIVMICGYAIFSYGALIWNGVNVDSPDLLSSVFMFLAAGILINMNQQTPLKTFFILGLVLAAGYLSKAVFFPFAFCIFIICFAVMKKQSARVFGAVAAFLLISAPYMCALSYQKERITFGDSGRLNYAWFVNPVFQSPNNWQGGPPGSGNPIHPTRQILQAPAVYEFASPVAGTYPPWFDPSYWWEGVTIGFDAQKQASVCLRNARFFGRHFLIILFCVLLFLIYEKKSFRATTDLFTNQWRVLIPVVIGLGLYFVGIDLQWVYVPLHPSTRYIAGFLVLLFVAALMEFRSVASVRQNRLSIVVLVASIFVFGVTGLHVLKGVTESAGGSVSHWTVAQELQREGIHTGDKVAIIGDEDDHVIWAHLTGVRIVAQVPEVQTNAGISAADFQELSRVLRKFGVRAIVKRSDSRYVVHFL